MFASSRGSITLGKFEASSVWQEAKLTPSRFLQHLQYTGFSKERQIAFRHKQAWFVRMKREAWEGPNM